MLFFYGKKLFEYLDQAILEVIDHPEKTQKLPLSERYSGKRSKINESYYLRLYAAG